MHLRRFHQGGLAGLLLFCLLAPAASADETAEQRQAAIFLKAMAYDQELANRCAKGLRIGVVVPDREGDERAEGLRFFEAVKGFASKKVRGLAIEPTLVAASNVNAVRDAVVKGELNLLYLAPGLGDLAGAVAAFAVPRKIVVMASRAEYLEAGAGLAVLIQEGKAPRVMVHLANAKAQGANFDAAFLKLAEVVR